MTLKMAPKLFSPTLQENKANFAMSFQFWLAANIVHVILTLIGLFQWASLPNSPFFTHMHHHGLQSEIIISMFFFFIEVQKNNASWQVYSILVQESLHVVMLQICKGWTMSNNLWYFYLMTIILYLGLLKVTWFCCFLPGHSTTSSDRYIWGHCECWCGTRAQIILSNQSISW